MADATFSDVVKAQQETNEFLRQQAIADGKPDRNCYCGTKKLRQKR